MAVDREKFANWVWEWIMSIEYTTNVKGNIDQGDSHRHNVYMDVWHALMRLQNPRPSTPLLFGADKAGQP